MARLSDIRVSTTQGMPRGTHSTKVWFESLAEAFFFTEKLAVVDVSNDQIDFNMFCVEGYNKEAKEFQTIYLENGEDLEEAYRDKIDEIRTSTSVLTIWEVISVLEGEDFELEKDFKHLIKSNVGLVPMGV